MTLGLRERKKLKTRAAIQREAMRLFLERGFEATTIDDIAEAVEISPSTFFNYFRSKEDVVLQDDLDPLILAAFNAQPANLSPIVALRNAMRGLLAGLTAEQASALRQRTAVLAADPALRAAMLTQFGNLVQDVAKAVAGRAKASPTDFAVYNLAGALVGVFMAALVAAANDPQIDLIKLVDAALTHLEAGLPLGPTEAGVQILYRRPTTD